MQLKEVCLYKKVKIRFTAYNRIHYKCIKELSMKKKTIWVQEENMSRFFSQMGENFLAMPPNPEAKWKMVGKFD